MNTREMKAFIDAVEKLAFEMPAPNPYTPRFVQLCVEARANMHRNMVATGVKFITDTSFGCE